MSNRISICLNDGDPVIVDSDQSPQKFSTAAKCLLLCMDSVQPLDLLGEDDPRGVQDTLKEHKKDIDKLLGFFEDFFEAFVDEHGTESLSESLKAIEDRSSSYQGQLVYLAGRLTKLEDFIKAPVDQQVATQLKEAAARNSLNIRLAKVEASEYLATNLASDLTEITDRVKVVETRCITSLNDINKILSRLNVLEDDTSSTSDELYDRIKKIEDCIRVQADQHVSTQLKAVEN